MTNARATILAATLPSLACVKPDAEPELLELSLADEMDLRAYFALDLPPAPGSGSAFGPMCERLAKTRNSNTKERPTPGVPWTEVLTCRMDGGTAGDPEDSFVAYVDARRRAHRVSERLSLVTQSQREVLQMYYARGATRTGALAQVMALASLTDAARRENRERAARARNESVGETVEDLFEQAKDARRPKPARDAACAQLDAVRRQATSLLHQARSAYASG